MPIRRVKVAYRLNDSVLVHTREWGVHPADALTRARILAILARQHDTTAHRIEVLTVHTYHRVENLPPL